MKKSERDELMDAISFRIKELVETCPLCEKHNPGFCAECPGSTKWGFRTTYCKAFVKARDKLIKLLCTMLNKLRKEKLKEEKK